MLDQTFWDNSDITKWVQENHESGIFEMFDGNVYEYEEPKKLLNMKPLYKFFGGLFVLSIIFLIRLVY
jgi:hypothetical protein